MMLLGEAMKDAGVITGVQLEKFKKDIKHEADRKVAKEIKEKKMAAKVTQVKEITDDMAQEWFGAFTNSVKEHGYIQAQLLATFYVEDRKINKGAVMKTARNYVQKIQKMGEEGDGFRKLLFWWDKETKTK